MRSKNCRLTAKKIELSGGVSGSVSALTLIL
jgi:hypothetical protein